LLAAPDSDPSYREACRAIAALIEKRELSASAVRKVVRDTASSYKLSTMPKNEHIIAFLP
jgi:hypothetical protein